MFQVDLLRREKPLRTGHAGQVDDVLDHGVGGHGAVTPVRVTASAAGRRARVVEHGHRRSHGLEVVFVECLQKTISVKKIRVKKSVRRVDERGKSAVLTERV